MENCNCKNGLRDVTEVTEAAKNNPLLTVGVLLGIGGLGFFVGSKIGKK